MAKEGERETGKTRLFVARNNIVLVIHDARRTRDPRRRRFVVGFASFHAGHPTHVYLDGGVPR